MPADLGSVVHGISAAGATPLVAAERANGSAKALGVIQLKDIVKDGVIPGLAKLNILHLYSPESAITSAIIFNALIIVALIPLALRGVRYRPASSQSMLRRNLVIYGIGGLTGDWGPGFEQRTNYLRFHMARLRRKLEDNPARPRHLLTEPGMGYRYQP